MPEGSLNWAEKVWSSKRPAFPFPNQVKISELKGSITFILWL